MIRAAIVGLGAWGKTLVDSVHRQTNDICFAHACTRSPEKVADLCREHGLQLSARYEDRWRPSACIRLTR